jgi:hypothetical protein
MQPADHERRHRFEYPNPDELKMTGIET